MYRIGGPSTLDILKGGQTSRGPRRKVRVIDHLALERLESDRRSESSQQPHYPIGPPPLQLPLRPPGGPVILCCSTGKSFISSLNSVQAYWMPRSDRVAGAMKQKLATYCSVCEGHTLSLYTRLHRFHTITHGPAAQAALQSLFGRPDLKLPAPAYRSDKANPDQWRYSLLLPTGYCWRIQLNDTDWGINLTKLA